MGHITVKKNAQASFRNATALLKYVLPYVLIKNVEVSSN